jgi:hypothetical protein
MCGMTTDSPVLRLDPRRPLLWRDPSTLQVGADPVLAVLADVDDARLRLVESLVVGVTRERLLQLAEHLGVRSTQVDALLTDLAGALRSDGATASAGTEAGALPAAAVHPLAVVGRGVGAERVAAVLAEAGHPIALLTPAADLPRPRRAAAVLVSTHVVDPHEHARWLRRDVPHLPIVFSEVAVTVGPLVLPGASPCLVCVERQRARHDPARAAIAAQLWGAPAAAETPTLALEAALIARGMLRSRSTATSVRLDAETATRTTLAWQRDHDCTCRGFSPRAEPAARRGSDSEPARPAPPTAARPTTTRALAARA